MYALGLKAGVRFDYGVRTQWQPVESQRLMLWAGRVGKQESFMDALGHLHFEQRKSASHRDTLLEAAKSVGLDTIEAERFLDTDELEDDVWESYRSTIHEKNIHAIPFFVFGPQGLGGPFRLEGSEPPIIINGSGDISQFARVFEHLLRHYLPAAAVGQSLTSVDPAAAPPRPQKGGNQ
uniref:DSBA-like thioredoxin domain-containing protein n=1 Tax=Octactis speculum TaxID=3111310 RepID=A0A7S2CWM5_9STRA|mmetsp:Transcript_40860/g.55644  ORF Transcript_40860/g.55644 Transcript_40860/m.55644 type:complete len:179 (+) Transcript_40860:358-894(+)